MITLLKSKTVAIATTARKNNDNDVHNYLNSEGDTLKLGLKLVKFFNLMPCSNKIFRHHLHSSLESKKFKSQTGLRIVVNTIYFLALSTE